MIPSGCQINTGSGAKFGGLIGADGIDGLPSEAEPGGFSPAGLAAPLGFADPAGWSVPEGLASGAVPGEVGSAAGEGFGEGSAGEPDSAVAGVAGMAALGGAAEEAEAGASASP